MGLFSKIFEVGKTLTENPNAVDDAMEKVSNLKQNANSIIDRAKEIQIENAKKSVDRFIDKLKSAEKQLDLNFLKARGKLFEAKVKYAKEYILNYTYSVPCKYDFLFKTGNYYAAMIDDKFGLINNKDENIIDFKYGYLECSDNEFILFSQDDKYGYMNFNEDVLIEPKFDDAGVFIDGLAYAAINTEAGIKYGYIDTSGEFVIEPQYDYAEDFCCNGITVVGKINDYGEIIKGAIDKNGKLVVACKHEIIKIHQTEIEYATESWHNPSFCDLRGVPNGHEEKYGYESDVPVPLNVVIPYNTSQLKYGFYTHTNEGDFCNIEPVFDEVFSFDNDGYALVKEDLYGVIRINK